MEPREAPMRFLIPVLVACATGCSPLPEVAAGACGNGVFEPAAGEECDAPAPGCGKPGTAGACRRTCEGDARCPSGSVCGADRICRRPTGTYSLSEFVGGGTGDLFQLLDADGDGLLDLADRSSRRITLFRNDGKHGFEPYASGAAPIPPTTTVNPGMTLARVPGDSAPLLATLTPDGVTLMSV